SRTAACRCSQRKASSSTCSSRMSGMKVAVGEGIARGPSVDLDGASLDAVQALGVGDQVLSFNKDLAVFADGDGAGTDAEGETMPRFDHQLIGGLLGFSGPLSADPAEDDREVAFAPRAPDQDHVPLGEHRKPPSRRQQNVAHNPLGVAGTANTDVLSRLVHADHD